VLLCPGLSQHIRPENRDFGQKLIFFPSGLGDLIRGHAIHLDAVDFNEMRQWKQPTGNFSFFMPQQLMGACDVMAFGIVN
jgi:hypothetical protein